MAADPIAMTAPNWRTELPALGSRLVTLREPVTQDRSALVDLLSVGDASRFGLEAPLTDVAVHDFIERAGRDRSAGLSFTYAVVPNGAHALVGLVHVRRLTAQFEAAEWDATLAPSSRGTGVFLDVARLAGSFAFDSVGVHRLEARVLLRNGRANGALRKLGAVQEGILRRSVCRGGEYLDQVLWSVLREDWNEFWVSRVPRVH